VLHNQVIKEAAWVNAGSVLAAEGDAFIVGFREPFDAAAFAVQVRR
jgi:class 3 adenylate cyclase